MRQEKTRAVVVVPWWLVPFWAVWMVVVWLMVGLWRLSVLIVRWSVLAYVWAGREIGRGYHRLQEHDRDGDQ